MCTATEISKKTEHPEGTRWSHSRWHHGWGFGRSREGEIRKADMSSALNLNPGSRRKPPAKLSVIEMTSKKKNIASTSSFAREARLYPPNQCTSTDENSDSLPYINPRRLQKKASVTSRSRRKSNYFKSTQQNTFQNKLRYVLSRK